MPNNRHNVQARRQAFAVHLLTASGSVLALLALVAAGEHRFVAMFWWLGAALAVDGIDGPLARKLQVVTCLPNWSGARLDNVIDYLTFVVIPAYALHASGMIEAPVSMVLAALIVLSSAIYYADTGMKTTDNFFSGFPVAWNMLVFTLFVVQPGAGFATAVVLISVVFTFLPVKFLHPVRVVRLRKLNLGVIAIWSVLGAIALSRAFDSPNWLVWGMAASGLYLYGIGAILQMFPTLGARNT